MSSNRRARTQHWAPADINEGNSEAITILQYWDVTTPPPKNAKLGAFRRGKRYRRISLEMHRVARQPNRESLELGDIFPDYENAAVPTYDKAFFRISKYVPIKNKVVDDATIISDISMRTKDRFSKPDYEWRTKFLLQVSRVAITEIKNENEVFFEAWDNGEVIARSLVFKEISQAKEFSYDLERLANEDPELNQPLMPIASTNDGPPRVIEPKPNRNRTVNSPGKKRFGRNRKKEDAQSKSPISSSRLKKSLVGSPQTVDTGRSTMAPSTTEPTRNQSSNKRRCCQNFCSNLLYLIASIFHFVGVAIALSLFLYSIAIYSVRPDPESKAAAIFFMWSVLIAWTHISGIIGIGEVCCGVVCFIRMSIFLSILSILLNLSLLVVFTVREDDIFNYLRNNHDKLFVSVNVIDSLYTHSLFIYCFMLAGSTADLVRMLMLQKLKGDFLRRKNQRSINNLSTPLLCDDEEFQGNRMRSGTF